MEKKIIIWLAIFFLVLGFCLRFIDLGKIPAGLHSDEAHAGYNAFLILKTGKNLDGQFWPIDIDSFGDYRPALISYLTIPSVAAFGLNEFSTRASVALFGFLLILLIYKFSLEIFQDRKIAFLSLVLLAVSPMAVIFSRATSEAVLDIFFEFAALLCVIISFKQKNPKLLLGSYLFWFLAYFSYHPSRVLTLPMGVATILLAYFQFKPGKKILFLATGVLFCYLVFPWFYFFRTPIGQGRASQVSVFAFPEVQRSIDESLTQEGPVYNPIPRLFHNKLVGYFLDISARYTSFFSADLVLFSLPKPDRYLVPQVGAVTPAEFIGLLLALGFYFYKKPKPLEFLPLILLLLAPLPSAVTFEDAPNFQRAAYLVPTIQIMAGCGIIMFLKTLTKRWQIMLISFFTVIIFSSLVFFLHQYFVHQPKNSRSIYSRATEMKAVATFLANNQSKKIILSEHDAPYLYYLFYNKINIFTTNFQKISNPKYFTGDYRINNLVFSKYICLSPDMDKDYDLFVINDGCPIPVGLKKLVEFRRSDDSLASTVYVKN